MARRWGPSRRRYWGCSRFVTRSSVGHIYDPTSKTKLYVHGIPTFQVGKTYVLFLPTESTLGFSSPLGLFQGSYTVKTVNNEKIVSNGRNLDDPTPVDNNRAITIPLAIDAHRPSQARLDNFINTIRSYNTP